MQEQELKQEIEVVDQQVNSLVVQDQESYLMAGNLVMGLNDLRDKIVEYWKSPKKKAFDAHKEIVKKESDMLKPVDDKLRTLKGKLNFYLTEQKRKEREEQEKLNRERREREEKERQKFLEQAAKAEAKGKIEKAEELLEKAEDVYVPPVIVEPEIKKTTHLDTGTASTTEDIEITITDPIEVIKEVAAGRLPVIILEIKEAKLKKHTKDYNLKSIPGCIIKPITKGIFRSK